MWSAHDQRKGEPVSTPLYSLAALGLFVATAVVLIVTGHGGDNGGTLLVGLIISTLPSLVASLFAERVSRDVRNGVLREKVKQASKEVLDETGVTEVVTLSQRGESVRLTMESLAELLRQSTIATKANTATREEGGTE